MPTTELVVGDWSDDGHGKTESIRYECNVAKPELLEAFNKGTKILGFDLTTQCDDFEINALEEDFVEAMKDHNLDIEEPANMDPDKFADLFMQIAKLGDPDLEYTLLKNTWETKIDIGGYGLFWM